MEEKFIQIYVRIHFVIGTLYQSRIENCFQFINRKNIYFSNIDGHLKQFVFYTNTLTSHSENRRQNRKQRHCLAFNVIQYSLNLQFNTISVFVFSEAFEFQISNHALYLIKESRINDVFNSEYGIKFIFNINMINFHIYRIFNVITTSLAKISFQLKTSLAKRDVRKIRWKGSNR